ncbi:Mss4-like protein [Rhexocercosporidium sp. MPI-PUGE-AT-0058]|nr:Mss4-like protein [Rhexocercosporidium sp. MPI-PUGE-AT-0058]
MEPSPEIKEYKGNCHCGLFKFTISVPELKSLRVCDCSYCYRKACEWVFPASNLQIQSGENELSTYQFGKKELIHSFCPKCGNTIIAKHLPSGTEGINARLLQSVDLNPLEKSKYKEGPSGEEYGSKYTPPSTYPAPSTVKNNETSVEGAELETFNGNCHCGAVAYTLISKPLNERMIISCNCSLCSRNGEVYTYPPASSVTFIGKENLTGYPFLSSDSLHSFCKICGTSVCVQVLKEDEDLLPLNLRTMMSGVNVKDLHITEHDGAKNDPQYVVS